MAKVYITEFATQCRDASGRNLGIAMEPMVATQVVAIGGTTAQSAAVNALTTFVRIHTDAICSIELGTDPAATANTRRMAAGSTEYFGVPLGKAYKVAVITNT